MSIKTIDEQIESFKKYLWSHTKPMDFAATVVEELLMEIQRQRTVMRAGLEEIQQHMQAHQSTRIQDNKDGFDNLMKSLKSERKGFYPQYLSVAEYDEMVRRRVDFDGMAQRIEIMQEMGNDGEEG